MKSELTNKLEAALVNADKTVKEAQQFVGAKSLRVSAMATHFTINEALELSKKVDAEPKTSNNPAT